MSNLVNAAELGRIVGVSRQRINNLAADGVLPRTQRGKFEISAAVQAFMRHKQVQAAAAESSTKTFAAERSRLAKLKADAAEREAKVESGELVRASEVENAWLMVIQSARAKLLLIPTKVAARASQRPPAEVRALLRKEINAALAEAATVPTV